MSGTEDETLSVSLSHTHTHICKKYRTINTTRMVELEVSVPSIDFDPRHVFVKS